MLKHSLKKGLIALSLAACFALPRQAKVITDVEGIKIELPDNVQRVADLWHANNQIVLLLGGANKLVGTTTTIAANPWYSAVYPNIKNVPVLTNGERSEERRVGKECRARRAAEQYEKKHRRKWSGHVRLESIDLEVD